MKKIIKIFAVSAIVACACSFFTLQSKNTIVKENVEALTQDIDGYDVDAYFVLYKAYAYSQYSDVMLYTRLEEYGDLCAVDHARADIRDGSCWELQIVLDD